MLSEHGVLVKPAGTSATLSEPELWLVAELEGIWTDPPPPWRSMPIWREPTPVPVEVGEPWNRQTALGIREATPDEIERFRAGEFEAAPYGSLNLSVAMGRMAEIKVVAARYRPAWYEWESERAAFMSDPVIPTAAEQDGVLAELRRGLGAVFAAGIEPALDDVAQQRAVRTEAERLGVPRDSLPRLPNGRPAGVKATRRVADLIDAISTLSKDGFARLVRRAINPSIDPASLYPVPGPPHTIGAEMVASMIYAVELDPGLLKAPFEEVKKRARAIRSKLNREAERVL